MSSKNGVVELALLKEAMKRRNEIMAILDRDVVRHEAACLKAGVDERTVKRITGGFTGVVVIGDEDSPQVESLVASPVKELRVKAEPVVVEMSPMEKMLTEELLGGAERSGRDVMQSFDLVEAALNHAKQAEGLPSSESDFFGRDK